MPIVIFCAGLLYFLTKPAFDGFFFGEDFITRSMYMAADGNILRAIFTSMGHLFRPTANAWSMLTQFFLPWDPLIHHIRNYAALVGAVVLLDLILKRLTRSQWARFFALVWFSVSKIHLTLIGYINCIDIIGPLLFELSTIFFFIRYLQNRKRLDYGLSLFFFTLDIFSRDAHFLFIVVLIALHALNPWRDKRSQKGLRAWLPVLPYLCSTMFYIAVRYAAVGRPVYSDQVYSLHALELKWVFTVLEAWVGTLFNVPFHLSDAGGHEDLATVLFQTSKQTIFHATLLAMAAMTSVFLIYYGGARIRCWIIVLMTWIGIRLLPVLLIRNLQIYYFVESMAAMSILLALLLDNFRARRALVYCCCMVLFLIVTANAYFHNLKPALHWRYHADNTAKLQRDIFLPNRDASVRSLTIVVPDKDQERLTWHWINPPVPGKHGAKLRDVHAMLRSLLSTEISEFKIIRRENFHPEKLRLGSGELVYVYDRMSDSYKRVIRESGDFVSRNRNE